eukprot:1276373-Pleurochrysis_carterae.AAC.2
MGEEDNDNKPFEEGGPARSKKDLEAIGHDFSKSYDTGATDRPHLEGDKLQKLVDVCLKYQKVWSRDASTFSSKPHFDGLSVSPAAISLSKPSQHLTVSFNTKVLQSTASGDSDVVELRVD